MRVFVEFNLGSLSLALPVEDIGKVVSVDRVVRVPGAPGIIKGVVELRGEVLPLVSLAEALGVGADRGSGKVIVAHLNGMKVGLLVEGVKGILRVREKDILPLEGMGSSPAFSEVIRQGDGFVLVLRPDSLMQQGEKSEEEIMEELLALLGYGTR